jgi:UDP-glucuronate 4-epimerase
MEHILITGVCGFIGYHLARRLFEEGAFVVGIDNLNPYYEVALKKSRLSFLEKNKGFSFVKGDLGDRPLVEEVFEKNGFDVVVHLAAQAGVRYSLVDPYSYGERNIMSLFPLLEGCRKKGVKHLLFASSSSVYGERSRVPFSAHEPVDHPVSLYAATKRAGELICHSYSCFAGLPVTALRFFTVYGPWGRPDMAYYRFTRLILEGRPIDIYNFGKMKRDFTYIDDIVEGIVRIMAKPPSSDPSPKEKGPDPASSAAPFRIFNIGKGQPVELLRFIEIIEGELGKKAEKNFLPIQPGDVTETFADIEDLTRITGFVPEVPLKEGIRRFVRWYREYYGV